jgi:hypothetical protein
MIRAKLLVFTMLTMFFFPSVAKLTAGDIGYVHCRAAEGYVYLYESTVNFQVLANLKCGQQIEIIDSQNSSWLRVRTADGKEGYLPQASVAATLAGPQQEAAPQAGEPAPPPKAELLAPAPAAAVGVSLSRFDESDTPRVEFAGGYSFLNADTSGFSQVRQNVNGFESSVTFYGIRRLGAEGNFSSYFLSQSENTINLGSGAVDLDQREYAILGGPRYNLGKLFVHGLLGMDRISLVPLGTRVAQDSLAAAVGVGAEWRLSRHLAIRTSGDWYYTHHNLWNFVTPGYPSYMQDNFRISVGIAYRAGSVASAR